MNSIFALLPLILCYPYKEGNFVKIAKDFEIVRFIVYD